MRSKEFWFDLAERAAKTFAQTLLSVLAVGVPIWEMDWVGALGIAAGATVISALMSLASSGVRTPESASLVAPRSVQGYVGEHRAPGE